MKFSFKRVKSEKLPEISAESGKNENLSISAPIESGYPGFRPVQSLTSLEKLCQAVLQKAL